MTSNRWLEGDVPRGRGYDRRFDELAAAGHDVHGEAALVDSFGPGAVLDAGCGTGRVAIELDRRGHRVVGVDLDPAMLAVARQKAPHLRWVEGDLADPDLVLEGPFEVVILAGNVLLFVTPGTEEVVLEQMAAQVAPAGRLIAGYSLGPGRQDLRRHDRAATRAGLELEDRWSTWDRAPFGAHSNYAVSVHRRKA
jgi:SAM-dependent methyltransferase